MESYLLSLLSPLTHLASRIVLYGTGPQHLTGHQPCPLLGMKPRLQSCPEPAEEPGRAWRGGEWLQGMLKDGSQPHFLTPKARKTLDPGLVLFPQGFSLSPSFISKDFEPSGVALG